jgi:hypothetical protein
MERREQETLVRVVIGAIAVVNGLSVFVLWTDGATLIARLLGGLVAGLVSYAGVRMIAS